MTSPSKFVRAHGHNSLSEVCRLVEIPRATMYRWFKTKPILFRVIIYGLSLRVDKDWLLDWKTKQKAIYK